MQKNIAKLQTQHSDFVFIMMIAYSTILIPKLFSWSQQRGMYYIVPVLLPQFVYILYLPLESLLVAP